MFLRRSNMVHPVYKQPIFLREGLLKNNVKLKLHTRDRKELGHAYIQRSSEYLLEITRKQDYPQTRKEQNRCR